MKDNIWYATISSWAGVVATASHYMVTLHGPGQEVAVEWYLDLATAIRWNRADPRYRYEEGDLARRFDTEEEATRAAVAVFERLADPAADLLVKGQRAAVVPEEALAGRPEHVERLRQVVERAKALNWWDGDRDQQRQMDALLTEWDGYQQEHFHEHPHQTVFGRGAPEVIKRSEEIAWGTPGPEPDYSIPLVVPPGEG